MENEDSIPESQPHTVVQTDSLGIHCTREPCTCGEQEEFTLVSWLNEAEDKLKPKRRFCIIY